MKLNMECPNDLQFTFPHYIPQQVNLEEMPTSCCGVVALSPNTVQQIAEEILR